MSTPANDTPRSSEPGRPGAHRENPDRSAPASQPSRARQLANARLLVVHGYGHTALLNPSTCASNYMTAYFRTGAIPPKGAVCRQDLPPFAPPAG